jgi:hypothetical protein
VEIIVAVDDMSDRPAAKTAGVHHLGTTDEAIIEEVEVPRVLCAGESHMRKSVPAKTAEELHTAADRQLAHAAAEIRVKHLRAGKSGHAPGLAFQVCRRKMKLSGLRRERCKRLTGQYAKPRKIRHMPTRN